MTNPLTKPESSPETRPEPARRPAQRTPTAVEALGEAAAFRPAHRPPMALLCLLDDGREDGEWFRLRRDRTLIGRSEGDVLVPHDGLLSSKHAEVVRILDQGQYRWFLHDLMSTNGTFVRVHSAVMRQGTEIMVGGNRFRFDSAEPGPSLLALPGDSSPRNKPWDTATPIEVVSSLVQLLPQGEGQRFFLKGLENTLGSDPRHSTLPVPNDPLLARRHAKIVRDGKGRWRIEDGASVNGTWLRVTRHPLEAACQIQVGEQRLLFKVLT